MKTDTFRTFVACELPSEIRSAIGHIQEDLKSRRLRLKWVRPENIHLTLKFLGDVAIDRIETIAGAIEEAAHEVASLSLSAKGLGVFPRIRRARVMWVGIGGQCLQLEQLQAAVADGLAEAGFPKENRPFKGHLTIGRVKAAIDSRHLAETLTAHSGFESAWFSVDEVILFRSELRPTGPVYTRLRTVRLNPH